jgi:hypothetical protein
MTPKAEPRKERVTDLTTLEQTLCWQEQNDMENAKGKTNLLRIT